MRVHKTGGETTRELIRVHFPGSVTTSLKPKKFKTETFEKVVQGELTQYSAKALSCHSYEKD